MDECKVYVLKRTNRGKDTYRLRWRDPVSGEWRNRATDSEGNKITDSKRADREAAVLADQLSSGTHRDVKRASWAAFVTDHVEKIPGAENRRKARLVLDEFGRMMNPESAMRVTYTMVESYVAKLRDRKLSGATVNQKLRYLRAAFNRGVKRGFLGVNPMSGDLFQHERRRMIRIVTEHEERGLLDAARRLYGSQLEAFIFTALRCGGRREELLRLTWDRVNLGDDPSVTFIETKTGEDRTVEINRDVADVLLRLKASTLRDGGPFVSLAAGQRLTDRWSRVKAAAGVEDVTVHDCRRTYVTRLIRAGVSMSTVAKLAGHSTIVTTAKYYAQVSREDRRSAVAKLVQAAG